MAQLVGFLPPTGKTWIAFPALKSALNQAVLICMWAVKQDRSAPSLSRYLSMYCVSVSQRNNKVGYVTQISVFIVQSQVMIFKPFYG